MTASGDIIVFRGATYTDDTTQLTATIENNTKILNTDVAKVSIHDYTFTATLSGSTTLTITWDITEGQSLLFGPGAYPYKITFERTVSPGVVITIPERYAGIATIS